MSDREWPWVKYDGLDSSRWVRLEDADKKVDELEAQKKDIQDVRDDLRERIAELQARLDAAEKHISDREWATYQDEVKALEQK